MTKRIPMKGCDEYDGLTKARKFYSWKKGQIKRIKRAYNKRFRKHNKEVNADNRGCLHPQKGNKPMTMDRDMDHYREDEIVTKLAWGELTDEAKGSLLLFHNRGGTIQRWWEGTQSWEDTQHPDWVEDHCYRVKPEQDGKRRFASIMGLSTTPAWTAYEAELKKETR